MVYAYWVIEQSRDINKYKKNQMLKKKKWCESNHHLNKVISCLNNMDDTECYNLFNNLTTCFKRKK